VFDGAHPPYKEDASPSALSVYGRTKAAGEASARQAPRHVVVRMPLQYGFSCAQDDSFVLKVIAALKIDCAREIDNAQARYPTLSDDVATAIAGLLERGYSGTIHLSGPTRATRLQMWRMIADAFDLPRDRITAAPQPVRAAAARPSDSRLDTTRYEQMGLPLFHEFGTGLELVRAQMEAAGYDWRAG
jgi:dTDP-4-dehydrorhamnose reductase